MKKPKSKRSRAARSTGPESAIRREKFKRRLIPALIIALLAFITMQFLSNSLKPLRAEIDQTTKQVEMVQKQTGEGLAVLANPEVNDAQNLKANKMMPSEPKLSEVISQVDSLARKYNLTWTAGAPSAMPVIDPNLPSGIQAWSMGATFSGPMASMYRFIDNMDSIDRVVTIESVSLQQAGSTYTGSFLLRFYALGA